MRDLKVIAEEVAACGKAWVPEAKLIGNVRADEVFRLAQAVEWLYETNQELLIALSKEKEETSRLKGVIDELAEVCEAFRVELKDLNNENGETHARIWQLQERLKEEMERVK